MMTTSSDCWMAVWLGWNHLEWWVVQPLSSAVLMMYYLRFSLVLCSNKSFSKKRFMCPDGAVVLKNEHSNPNLNIILIFFHVEICFSSPDCRFLHIPEHPQVCIIICAIQREHEDADVLYLQMSCGWTVVRMYIFFMGVKMFCQWRLSTAHNVVKNHSQ